MNPSSDASSRRPPSHRPSAAQDDAGQSLVVLALDTGSPTVSVALARDGVILSQDVVDIGRSSRRLLPMIDATLADAGVTGADLSGLVALAGPGSFTGLRVGLATTLGLHQALSVPAAAVPTLPTLARSVLAEADGPGRVFALVDVLRDEWAFQEFDVTPAGPDAGAALLPRGEAGRIPVSDLLARVEAGCAEDAAGGAGDEVTWLVGFGVDALEPRLGGTLESAVDRGRVRLRQPTGLAAAAATAATLSPPAWDPRTLTAPLYFRPPATTQPKKHLPGGRGKAPGGASTRASAES